MTAPTPLSLPRPTTGADAATGAGVSLAGWVGAPHVPAEARVVRAEAGEGSPTPRSWVTAEERRRVAALHDRGHRAASIALTIGRPVPTVRAILHDLGRTRVYRHATYWEHEYILAARAYGHPWRRIGAALGRSPDSVRSLFDAALRA